jgi:hypothetical protein
MSDVPGQSGHALPDLHRPVFAKLRHRSYSIHLLFDHRVRPRSASGITRPSAFAVLRLIFEATSVACSIGSSGGWVSGRADAPRVSTKPAARNTVLAQNV